MWEGGDESCNHIEQKCLASDKNKLSGGRGDRTRETISMQYKSVCKKCGAKRKDQQLGLEKTPEEFVKNLVNVFREIKRVLKDDGTVWLNLGDSYGDEKQLIGIPWRVAFALQSDGWYLRQDIIWHKPKPMPESVKDRCTKAHEYIFLLTKSAKYYYDADAIKEPVSENSIKRAEYGWHCDRPSTKNASMNGKGIHTKKMGNRFVNKEGRNKRSVWKINTQPYKEAHFAVFPEKIPELCIKAGSRVGDTVLDPFFGSGTTGYVAQRLQRKWIGIELNPEYIKIAEQRFLQQELFTMTGETNRE